MPIGIQRLNTRHQPPTDRIVFIKPLPGPSSSIAEEFLSRVAAICHPVMKSNALSVMTLEEYEPNREFIGRNFNAGEVIQLVLRAHSGAWLSFRSVVMVMMHELAHCKQMNHSREFWKVRNGYADEMRGLWARNYTGEGVWGPGRSMGTGTFEKRPVHEGEMPENLCGGTYRSRRRGGKRKRGGQGEAEKLSHAERQQRRIARKFGVNGQALGEDEIVRVGLEGGRRPPGKPKVANSKRGRELRAQAALARFGQQGDAKEEVESGASQTKLPFKKEGPDVKQESAADSETESDDDEPVDDGPAAVDQNGQELQDSEGRSLVKVCPDEDSDDVYVKSELKELQDLNQIPPADKPTRPQSSATPHKDGQQQRRTSSGKAKAPVKPKRELEDHSTSQSLSNIPKAADDSASGGPCAACSLSNPSNALTCMACSNVLLPDKAPGNWKCKSKNCKGGVYINSGDVGVCGICGQRRH